MTAPARQLAGALARALDDSRLRWEWRPLAHQVAPLGWWDGWLLIGGRGAGKTEAGTEFMKAHAAGPACMRGPTPHRMAIIAPTEGDAAYSCFEGPSGLRAHDPGTRIVTRPGGTLILWPNGSYAKLFGADKPDQINRLRSGGNNCFVFAEEVAAWRYLDEAWFHMEAGLRIGPHPQWVASTTPKPRKKIRELYAAPPGVVVTHGTMHDNPYVDPGFRERMERRYGGTTLADQELKGLIIEQDENALWQRQHLARDRITLDQLPALTNITVNVDPSGGADVQGITVVGSIWLPRPDTPGVTDGHGYLLDDRSCNLDPDGWGSRAVDAAVEWGARKIVYESDYGRDMPKSVILGALKKRGVNIPVQSALASALGNKRTRAWPVAALSRNGLWHHVGYFPDTEDEMCTWTEQSGYSPNRIDSLSWGAWAQRLVSTVAGGQVGFGGQLAAATPIGIHRRRP